MSDQQISWLKFAQQLAERYDYLLNADLCFQIAQDARDFVKAETVAEVATLEGR